MKKYISKFLWRGRPPMQNIEKNWEEVRAPSTAEKFENILFIFGISSLVTQSVSSISKKNNIWNSAFQNHRHSCNFRDLVSSFQSQDLNFSFLISNFQKSIRILNFPNRVFLFPTLIYQFPSFLFWFPSPIWLIPSLTFPISKFFAFSPSPSFVPSILKYLSPTLILFFLLFSNRVSIFDAYPS